MKTKNGAGLLHPCLLLNLLSPMYLSLFSLLGVGLVTYYSAEWFLKNNHFIILPVGDFEKISQKVFFCMFFYMDNHYLLLSPPSMNIGPGNFCVEFWRMSEGAEHNGLAFAVDRKPLLGILFCCQKRTHYDS